MADSVIADVAGVSTRLPSGPLHDAAEMARVMPTVMVFVKSLGGVTRDIFSEGLQLPFVKIFRAGKENPELTSIIRANVRVPERAMVPRFEIASSFLPCAICTRASLSTVCGWRG